jgi:flagellar basal body-associated protein FliL
MGRDPKPERKKISMKTRLIIIVVMLVIVNLIFYVAFDSSDDSTEEEKIEQEFKVTLEESNQEQQYAKFNPPKP